MVRLAAFGLGLFAVLVTMGQILRSRGERMLAPWVLLVGVAGLATSAVLAVLLPPIALHGPLLAACVTGGALVGVAAGVVVRARRDSVGVVVGGGSWHMLPAALALLGLQASGVAGSLDGVVIATTALVAATAFAVGAAATVVIRGTLAPAPVPALPGGGDAPAVPSPPASAGGGTVRITCGSCGAPVATGWRHCVTCGAVLARD